MVAMFKISTRERNQAHTVNWHDTPDNKFRSNKTVFLFSHNIYFLLQSTYIKNGVHLLGT